MGRTEEWPGGVGLIPGARTWRAGPPGWAPAQPPSRPAAQPDVMLLDGVSGKSKRITLTVVKHTQEEEGRGAAFQPRFHSCLLLC